MKVVEKISRFIRGDSVVLPEEERRSFYRYQIPKNFSTTVKFTEPPHSSLHPSLIKDISLGGVRLECKVKVDSFSLKQTVKIQIIFEHKELTVTGTVLRWNGRELILQFALEERKKLAPLVRVFPRLLGLSLKECPVKQRKEMMPCRWFHGQCYTDIFVWLDHKNTNRPLERFLLMYENMPFG